jgi:hypothetical protein
MRRAIVSGGDKPVAAGAPAPEEEIRSFALVDDENRRRYGRHQSAAEGVALYHLEQRLSRLAERQFAVLTNSNKPLVDSVNVVIFILRNVSHWVSS